MQITLPDDLSVQLHQLAVQNKQSFETFVADRLRRSLTDRLTELSPTEQAELEALRYLSNDALWTIAAEQMALTAQERVAQLLEDNRRGMLPAFAQNELALLIERGDQLMLRKAEAIKLLKQRGYTVSQTDLLPHYA